jgi:hypothetical protein
MSSSDLSHLGFTPTYQKPLLANKMQQCSALTKPTKHTGKVIALNTFAKVKAFQKTPSSGMKLVST